jgi:two-component system OmpR family sensor kinase
VSQFQPNLPLASADEALLVRAVAKLLSNALSYTPHGGTLTIRTATQARDAVQWITLTIADTGPGLSEQDRAHLFDRFYRGEAARDYVMPGAGLGLAICKTLIDKLGGAITVESDPGHGAAFTIWLRAI